MSFDETFRIIGETTTFKGLSSDVIEKLAKIAIPKTFIKDEFICYEGEHTFGFFLLVDGGVKIIKITHSGEFTYIISNPPQTFSEFAILKNSLYPYSIQAIQKSKILIFGNFDFLNLFCGEREVMKLIFKEINKDIHLLVDKASSFATKNVNQRLVEFLLSALEENRDGNKITLEVKKRDLATQLGTIPETLSRNFNILKKINAIEVNGKTIIIKDKDRLSEIV